METKQRSEAKRASLQITDQIQNKSDAEVRGQGKILDYIN